MNYFFLLLFLFQFSVHASENTNKIIDEDLELTTVLGEDFGPQQSVISIQRYEEILRNIEQSSGGTLNENDLFIPLEPGRGDLITAGILGSAAIMVFANDAEIMSFVQSHRNSITEVVSDYGESFGNDLTLYGSGMGLVLGIVLKNNKIKRVSLMAIKAMTYTGLITRILKNSFGRHRPSEDQSLPYQFDRFGFENQSFPSGHTTQAFAFATVIAEEFKDTKYIPLLAYSSAAIAGWSRVHGEGDGRPAHWGSDVLIGAMIGHFVTKQIYNSKLANRGILLSPSVGPSGAIMLNMTYQRRPKDFYDDLDDFCKDLRNSMHPDCQGSIFGNK